jgi:SAM-dependent methyltransferase
MTGLALRDLPATHVYASALRGHPCLVLHPDGTTALLPTDVWLRDADASDDALLALCQGPTIDVGCGPGRMAEALARRGRPVLAVDVVPEAVQLSLARGVVALRRDVFDALPGEGRWGTALLADGNIGIGGDPVALLERMRSLVAPTGRVVVDLAPPGTGIVTRHLRLESALGRSVDFPWSVVGADAVDALAAAAGLAAASVHRFGDRWCAVLEVAS